MQDAEKVKGEIVQESNAIVSDIQGVIWDLDDTLINSREAHYHAWSSVMTKRGIPFTHDFFLWSYGMNNKEALVSLVGTHISEGDIPAISEEKEQIYRDTIRSNAPALMPGVLQWLDYFQAHNVMQCVASSGPMANIVTAINSVQLSDYFFSLLTGAPLKKGKPDPQLFFQAAASLNLKPEHCLVIEDSYHGYEAALRAGMRCILVRLVQSQDVENIRTLAAANTKDVQYYLCVSSLAGADPEKTIADKWG